MPKHLTPLEELQKKFDELSSEHEKVVKEHKEFHDNWVKADKEARRLNALTIHDLVEDYDKDEVIEAFENLNGDVRVVSIPTLNALYDFEEFMESFKSKYNFENKFN